ncbi:MAG: AAA family ATPase, partial [Bacilli bacterium]|nr:AAA family ATPase [Bacilli bacterium]
MINPFVLEFGVQPPEYIDRFKEASEIIEEFSSPSPSSHSYAILGPRGCGKTVLLNYIVEKLDNREGWICANLNSKDDLLLQLAGALEDKTAMRFPKLQAEFSFSFSFMSLSLKGKEKVADIHALLRRMMETLHKHNYRVLVAIDDISLYEYVETFIKEFQLLRGQRFPIFLLTTGLYSAFNKIEE